MARVKRYWIRYNKGADRLEQQITIGTLRPNGPGWVEVDIDHCCNLIDSCGEQTIEVTIAAVTAAQECTFILTIDGLNIGAGVVLSVPSTVQEIVDALNTFYTGIATFSIENETTGLVEIKVEGISQTIALDVNCVVIP